MSRIPIILIDDDLEFSKTFKTVAKSYGFAVTWFTNLEDGFNCLRKDIKKSYKALVLDARCFVSSTDTKETDAFLGKAIAQLPNICKERYLPTVINTAYSEKVLTEPFKTLLKEQNISVFSKLKRPELLFEHLTADIAKAPSFYAKQKSSQSIDKNYLVNNNKGKNVIKDEYIIDMFNHDLGQKIGAASNEITSIKKFLERQKLLEKELFEKELFENDGSIGELIQSLQIRIANATNTLTAITKLAKKTVDLEHTDLKDFFYKEKEKYNKKSFEFHICYNIIEKIEVLVDKTFLTETIDLLIKNAERHGFSSDKKHNILFELSLVPSIMKDSISKDFIKISYKNDGKPFPKNFYFKDFIQWKKSKGEKARKGIGGYLINQMVLLHNGLFQYGELSKDTYNIHFEILLPIKL